MAAFALWAATVFAAIGGIYKYDSRVIRAAERATGQRCAVIPFGDPEDARPNQRPNETLLPTPLYGLFGGQLICVQRGRGDRARLREWRRQTERVYWTKYCRLTGECRSRP